MAPALHHALLGVCVAALAAAALRAAALAASHGLARPVAAAVLATATAAGEAMVLGLAGLGTSPVALTLAAIATWLAARRLLPPPPEPLVQELGRWWGDREAGERLLLGALAGAGAAWAAWQLRYPALGFDAVHYHLPEIVIWVQEGSPGSVEPILPGLPVGNYPLTDEVVVAWAMGVARGFVPVTIWPWAMLALTAAAGWLGARALGVPRPHAGLAVGAVCVSPAVIAWQSNGAMTDPPALAFLVACAALCSASASRPALLAPAIVAAGLAVGMKTTMAPMAALALVLGLRACRGRLAGLRVPLALAAAAALLVGGAWYARNLVDHGSPFWPLIAAPWGDAAPPSVEEVNTSFLDRPAATIERIGDLYLQRFGGGIVLIAGGLLAPLISRRRAALAGSAATALGLLLWARAPFTGVAEGPGFEEGAFSTTRYLLPVVASGALTLGLAARGGRGAQLAAGGVLGAAVTLGLVQTFDLGFPTVPSPTTPLAGAIAGAVVALAAGRPRPLARLPGPAPALATVVLGALLAVPASGFLERHADTRAVLASGLERWLAAEPGFDPGRQPVAMAPTLVGVAAGDRLRHPLSLIPQREPCARVVRRAREGFVVVYRGPLPGPELDGAERCLTGLRPAYDDGLFSVYRERP